ncbi:pseudouridylate synthase 7 homolog [Bombyx mandarina]|uniref:Pseudouridylate synthase 7 homolog n=1 Tax=Bombyx mandarina TaxID=7092 RepID=A0A6J2JBA2_BOMMA|nr:pseudouridylate synthase 7 homolog [Bombyx mandarina]
MNRGGRWNRKKSGRFSTGGRGRGGHGFDRGNRNFVKGGPPNQWKKIKRDIPGPRISESEIGITEYISDHKGFIGIIKWRYSDFQVSEINEDGVIAKLTDLKPPEPPEDEVIDDDESLLLNKYNLEILPMEIWDKINVLSLGSKTTTESVEIDANDISKEERTKMHDAVKKAFGDSIVSSTVNIDGKKFMRFEKYRKGVYVDRRIKWVWPEEYVHFIVHKENCDTMEAAGKIAARLRLNVKPTMLGYAGTKDRRAKTSQWFSMRKVDPRKIVAACQDLREIHVGNFTFSSKHIKLGMLKGNRFRIAIRNVEDGAGARAACELVCRRGFINYFGLQRFGTQADMPTYHIGRFLLQGEYQKAIDGILSVREGPLEHALRLYAEGAGAGGACAAVPARAAALPEARLLRALADTPTDLVAALERIPRNARLLYIHSYQSYVWNHAASERVWRLGLRPAAGDLVPRTAPRPDDLCDDNFHLEVTEGNEGDAEDADPPRGGGAQPGDQAKDESSESTVDIRKLDVKALTQEDIDSSRYTIFDVVLPLPGYSVEYPDNMKGYYEEFLEKDGLDIKLKNRVKTYSARGAVRRLVQRPHAASWALHRYSRADADLLASDLDELAARVPPAPQEDGKYEALLLTMTLPPSCYATMMLRELMKTDTSSRAQALLSHPLKRTASPDPPPAAQ